MRGRYQVRDAAYGPSVVRRELVFLPPWALSCDIPICIFMKLNKRDRVHLDSIGIRSLPKMGYIHARTLVTINSRHGIIPPSEDTLLRVAIAGYGWKPSLACQGARCVPFPAMVSSSLSYASSTSHGSTSRDIWKVSEGSSLY